MPAVTDTFDLARLLLHAGEGRRLELAVRVDPLTLGGQRYAAADGPVSTVLDVARTTAGGYSLRLRFEVAVAGPCMRCLGDVRRPLEVEAREVDLPGGGEELSSPYLAGPELDLRAWAHDALALALPVQVVCREDCRGLCPQCGADLNTDPEHAHESAPDSRWAKLGELRLE